MDFRNSKSRLDKLVLRLKRGDSRAAGAIYDELARKVYGFCLSRVQNREVAEDLTNDIFVKLLEKAQTFDGKRGNFTVWFWQLARNAVIDHYRGKKETPFSVLGDERVESIALVVPHDALDKKLEYEAVSKFLSSLKAEEKQIFEMRYLAELSYKDMSGILGKSEGALRVMMTRLKRKIKENFQK